jgi:hypothetical protein
MPETETSAQFIKAQRVDAGIGQKSGMGRCCHQKILSTASFKSCPLVNDRFWPRILLKKAKVAGLQKSRECGIFVTSDAARLSRFDANVAGRF